MGGWRRNRAQTLEDPLLQRAKIQEEKEKKTKQKSKTKRRKEKWIRPSPKKKNGPKEVKRPGPQQQQQQEQWRVLAAGGAKKDQKCRFAKCNAQQLPSVERSCFLLCLEIGELRFAVEQAYYKRVMNSPSPFVCC
jgi:hypothetical protein